MIQFGTDGVRGRAGQMPISAEGGVAIGRAAARLARELGQGRVLVGRDTRPSGSALEAAVVSGVLSNGCVCMLAGVLPTAGVGIGLDAGLADVGVMITASHNPAADNGFKIIGSRGRKLDDDQIARVETWLAESPPVDVSFGQVVPAHADAWLTWLEAVDRATPGRSILAGHRIAIDLANGAASPCARWLVENTDADWVIIGDGTGSVNDGVGSEHIDTLCRVVVEQGCVAGFAVDGDADRCRMVDGAGDVIPGDALTWILARDMGARQVAVTVMSNGALELNLPDTRVIRTAVGDRFLRQAMDRDGIPLGAEESGHVLFEDHASGDGIVTGLRVLTALLKRDQSIADTMAAFVLLPRILTRVPVSSRPQLDQVPEIAAAREQGLASLGAGGRVFLRYSGTEDFLRVLVEGADAAVVSAVSQQMTRVSGQALS